MDSKRILILILQMFLMNNVSSKSKTNHQLNETRPSPRKDNPNFIRDRKMEKMMEMPSVMINRFRQVYDPAWMDYCDPYHCNDYQTITCGLNRSKMKFKWFQSLCHLILNNQCAAYRGNIKYDLIATRFCRVYVMYLRGGCETECEDEIEPVCAMSSIDGHVVIFKNTCALEAFNCNHSSLQEYDIVYMSICEHKMQYPRGSNLHKYDNIN